jgi:hypothetical protein
MDTVHSDCVGGNGFSYLDETAQKLSFEQNGFKFASTKHSFTFFSLNPVLLQIRLNRPCLFFMQVYTAAISMYN